MKLLNFTPLKDADASVDQISDPFPAWYIFYFSAQCISTGASTGSVKFQVSNDSTSQSYDVVNWSDIDQSVDITAASTLLIPKFDSCYQWARIVYSKNNGSAGKITVNVKALGA